MDGVQLSHSYKVITRRQFNFTFPGAPGTELIGNGRMKD